MRTHFRFVFLLFSLAIVAMPGPVAAQWRYPPIYPPYGGYRYAMPESNLRINVTPKDALVYVDGYFAGKVDDLPALVWTVRTFDRRHGFALSLCQTSP